MGNDDQPMSGPTPLPSRERAAELARTEAAICQSIRARNSADASGVAQDAIRFTSEAAAILSAYAAGRLVPVERVAEMREDAAIWCEGEANEADRKARNTTSYEDRGVREYMRLRVYVMTEAATAIRALPLDAAPDGTGGGDAG